MNVFQLTRALVDIESITGNEKEAGEFLFEHLRELCAETDGSVETIEVAPDRFNVFAHWGHPTVTFSTHIDTVPPFIPSGEDDTHLYGRGSCDAKGILASMLKAIEALLAEGRRDLGLLAVVGEERNSAGAFAAARSPRGSRYLINGEPTENLLALGSKGALRLELTARGKMAHSAYPELGDSAIDKLLDVLEDLRRMPLPADPMLGASTLNIGTITGGRAPNVIADHAKAELLIRLIDDGRQMKEDVRRVIAGRIEMSDVLTIPALRLGARDGFQNTVVAFTTDIPAFGGAWGQPFLIGPGSIHVAHTSDERVAKQDLLDATTIYQRLAAQLLQAAN
jgi:acetylornithine deacetylase